MELSAHLGTCLASEGQQKLEGQAPGPPGLALQCVCVDGWECVWVRCVGGHPSVGGTDA